MKKGQIYEGIVFVPEEEQYVTVKNGIPGQKNRFMINKFKRGNAEGRLLEVLEKSPLETREPVCSIFPACGGCMYQTMPYEEQVKMKEGQIRRIMDPVVKGEYVLEGVKHSPKEFHYRNKMEFSFGDEFKDGPLSLGLHKKGSTYDVAQTLGLPVILVINSRGAAMTLVAVVKGIAEFRPDSNIRGILLNRVSAMLYPRLKELLENDLARIGNDEI